MASRYSTIISSVSSERWEKEVHTLDEEKSRISAQDLVRQIRQRTQGVDHILYLRVHLVTLARVNGLLLHCLDLQGFHLLIKNLTLRSQSRRWFRDTIKHSQDP